MKTKFKFEVTIGFAILINLIFSSAFSKPVRIGTPAEEGLVVGHISEMRVAGRRYYDAYREAFQAQPPSQRFNSVDSRQMYRKFNPDGTSEVNMASVHGPKGIGSYTQVRVELPASYEGSKATVKFGERNYHQEGVSDAIDVEKSIKDPVEGPYFENSSIEVHTLGRKKFAVVQKSSEVRKFQGGPEEFQTRLRQNNAVEIYIPTKDDKGSKYLGIVTRPSNEQILRTKLTKDERGRLRVLLVVSRNSEGATLEHKYFLKPAAESGQGSKISGTDREVWPGEWALEHEFDSSRTLLTKEIEEGKFYSAYMVEDRKKPLRRAPKIDIKALK